MASELCAGTSNGARVEGRAEGVGVAARSCTTADRSALGEQHARPHDFTSAGEVSLCNSDGRTGALNIRDELAVRPSGVFGHSR